MAGPTSLVIDNLPRKRHRTMRVFLRPTRCTPSAANVIIQFAEYHGLTLLSLRFTRVADMLWDNILSRASLTSFNHLYAIVFINWRVRDL